VLGDLLILKSGCRKQDDAADKTSKRGIHSKRLKAGWNNDYLLHLLRN